MDALALIDPELREIAQRMRDLYAGFSPMSLEKLEIRRAGIAALAQPPTAGIAVEERRIAGWEGNPEVTIFVVNAKPGAAAPGILHIHGGGFNASTARASLCPVQELAQALDCVVVTVEYRLAPETVFPGALADNYAALGWMHENAGQIGVDPARIALLGESAGGGHAALLAIAARDRGKYPICFQALIYPMLDDRTGSSRAVPEHIGAYGWNAEANRFGWQCYLGQAPGTDTVPVEAVPARIQNLAGLPPTFIGCGALDLFIEENMDFANRLIVSGVPTELLVLPGCIHGFDSLVRTSAVAKRFTEAKLAALRRGLGKE